MMRAAPAFRKSYDPEIALMARLRNGDDRAFAALIELHLQAVAGFAYRMLGDASEAEDIAQETFLRLWRNRRRWQPQARLRTWLYRVARNLCIDRFRRREIVTASVPDRPDPAMGPADLVQERQMTQAVGRAIQRLPGRQRAAIVLVHQEAMGNIEAAEVLGVSVEAVESLLARGRRKLRKDLAAEFPGLLGEV